MIGVLEFINTDCLLACPDCERVFASEEVFAMHRLMYGGCVSDEELRDKGIASIGDVWQAYIALEGENFTGGPIPTLEDHKNMHKHIAEYMAKWGISPAWSARVEGSDDERTDLG